MSDPQKDRVRRAQMAILLPLAILTMLYRMGVSPLISGRRALREGIDKFSAKMQEVRPVLDAAEQRIQDELSLNPRLNKILQAYVYESEDQFTEISLKLDDFARSSGMNVNSFRQTKLPAASWMEDRDKKYAFKPFCVTVEGGGNYDQIHRFVGMVERDSPFATLSSIFIAGIKDDPDDLTATLQIEWPMWTDLGQTEYRPLMREE